MLHWAKSFSVIAVIASVAALLAYPSPFGALAVFMTAVFVTLAILSLITGALGRRRDGWSYSATQALGIVAFVIAAVWASHAWLAQGWSLADAERVIESGLAAVTRVLR